MSKSPSWVRYTVENRIKNYHPELLEKVKQQGKQEWYDEWFKPGNWFVPIIGAVVIFFLLFLIPLCTGTYSKEFKDFVNAIDQRTGNLSTISGMSLAVIAFLVSNTAIKEPYAYQLLFRKTKLYAVIIYVLSVLGLFVFVSNVHYLFTPGKLYDALAVTAGFEFLTVIFLIGYLFIKIINFIDPEQIDEMMNTELVRAGSVVIYEGLIIKYSLQEFKRVMAQQGIKPYNEGAYIDSKWLQASMRIINGNNVAQIEKKQKYVVDIDLISLAHFLDANKTKDMQYNPLYIGLKTEDSGDYIFVPGTNNSVSISKALKKFIVLESKIDDVISVSTLRNHFDERLVVYSETGKEKELIRLLKGFTSLFEQQFRYKSEGRYDLTQNFTSVLRSGIQASVNKKYFSCFRELFKFYLGQTYMSLNAHNINMFMEAVAFYPENYALLKVRESEAAYKEFLPYTLDASEQLEFLLYRIGELKKENKEISYDQFSYNVYFQFGMMLFYMVSTKDYARFKKAAGLIEDRNTHTSYRRHTLFGIKAWIIHLRKHEKIASSETADLLEQLPIRYNSTTEAIEDIIYFRRGLLVQYMGWQTWRFPEYLYSGEFSISNPYEWLTLGFMVEHIRDYNLSPSYNGSKTLDTDQITFLINDLKKAKEYFLKHFEDWSLILRSPTEEIMSTRADQVILVFELINTRFKQAEIDSIASTEIDQDKVQSYREIVRRSWEHQAYIINQFKRVGKMIPLTDNTGLHFIGNEVFIGNIKRFFLKQNYNSDLNLFSTVGSEAGRAADSAFYDTIVIQKPITEEGKLIGVVENAIKALRDADYKPDCILVPSNMLYMDEGFTDDERYVYDPNPVGEKAIPNSAGKFDGIPIFYTYSSSMENYVIVADFAKAFSMDYEKDDTRVNGLIDIRLKTLSYEEASTIAADNSPFELHPDELAVQAKNIQNGLDTITGIIANFKITDTKAFILSAVVDSRSPSKLTKIE